MVLLKSIVVSTASLVLDNQQSNSSSSDNTNNSTTAANKPVKAAQSETATTKRLRRTLLNLIFFELHINSLTMQNFGNESVPVDGHKDRSVVKTPDSTKLSRFFREDKYSFHYTGLSYVGKLYCTDKEDAMRKFNILSEVEECRSDVNFQNSTQTDINQEQPNKRIECIISIPRTSKLDKRFICVYSFENGRKMSLANFESKELVLLLIADSFKTFGLVFHKIIDKNHYDASPLSQIPSLKLIVLSTNVHPVINMITNCIEYYFNMSQKVNLINIHLMKIAIKDNTDSSEALNFQKMMKIRKKQNANNNLTEDLTLDMKVTVLQKFKIKNGNKEKLVWKSVPLRQNYFQVTRNDPKLISLTITHNHPIIRLNAMKEVFLNVVIPSQLKQNDNEMLQTKIPIIFSSLKNETVDALKNIHKTTILSRIIPNQNNCLRKIFTLLEKYQSETSKFNHEISISLTNHLYLTHADRSAFITIEMPLQLCSSNSERINEKWYESLSYDINKCLYIPLFKRFNGMEIIYSIHHSDSLISSNIKSVGDFKIDNNLVTKHSENDSTKYSSVLGKGLPDNEFVTMEEIEDWLARLKEWQQASSDDSSLTEHLLVSRVPDKFLMLIKGDFYTNRVAFPCTLRPKIWQAFVFSHGDPHSELIDFGTLNETYTKLVDISKVKSHYKSVISIDSKRTFPTLNHFIDKGDPITILENFLNAFAALDPAVGYFQGFAFIASTLLSIMPSETAFHTFVCFMNVYEFRDFFTDTNSFKALTVASYSLNRLIQIYLPHVEVCFEESGVEVKMISLSWFLTLFTSSFPLNFSAKVLDLYIMFGTPILYSIALSVMNYGMGFINGPADFETVQSAMANQVAAKMLEETECVKVLKNAFSFSVKKSQLAMFAQEFEQLNMNEMIDAGYATNLNKNSSNRKFDKKNFYASWYSSNCSHITNAKEFYRACLHKINNLNMDLQNTLTESSQKDAKT